MWRIWLLWRYAGARLSYLQHCDLQPTIWPCTPCLIQQPKPAQITANSCFPATHHTTSLDTVSCPQTHTLSDPGQVHRSSNYKWSSIHLKSQTSFSRQWINTNVVINNIVISTQKLSCLTQQNTLLTTWPEKMWLLLYTI